MPLPVGVFVSAGSLRHLRAADLGAWPDLDALRSEVTCTSLDLSLAPH